MREVSELSDVEKAAVRWWEGHRPLGWSKRDHVKNALINCRYSTEIRLALAVARLVGQREKGGER
jgi:hypothetical protein